MLVVIYVMLSLEADFCLPLSEYMKYCAHEVHFGWGETEMLYMYYMKKRQENILADCLVH